MKTIEEFYKELSGSKELQEELKTVVEETLGAFLKKHGCEASAKEFTAFVKAQEDGVIGDDDAEAVAGGAPFPTTRIPDRPGPPIV